MAETFRIMKHVMSMGPKAATGLSGLCHLCEVPEAPPGNLGTVSVPAGMGFAAHLWWLPVKDMVNIHSLPELHVLKGRREVRPHLTPSIPDMGKEEAGRGWTSPFGASPLISAGQNCELWAGGRWRMKPRQLVLFLCHGCSQRPQGPEWYPSSLPSPLLWTPPPKSSPRSQRRRK